MTINEVAQAIYLVTKDKKDKDLKNSFDNVISFLVRKRLLFKSSAILESLNKIVDKADGVVRVNLKSATKINEATKTQIVNLLKKKYSAFEFIFSESIDTSLLGGVRIELENDVIDLSTKNKIGQLEEFLQKI